MNRYFYVLLISMIPLIELRGAIPAGCAMGLPWYTNFILCVIGNMIPVPLILLFIDQIFSFMKRYPHLGKIARFFEEKGEKNKGKVTKYASWGLLLFVGIPLPGTGAWTGALVASLLKMNKKNATLSIFGGVLVAGVLLTLISYGVLGFLSFLL
ncbi:MAG: small multi-drug export protein [Clostridia bacterium]|nr:small multi-drug export protein [Clostridia bacterium]